MVGSMSVFVNMSQTWMLISIRYIILWWKEMENYGLNQLKIGLVKEIFSKRTWSTKSNLRSIARKVTFLCILMEKYTVLLPVMIQNWKQGNSMLQPWVVNMRVKSKWKFIKIDEHFWCLSRLILNIFKMNKINAKLLDEQDQDKHIESYHERILDTLIFL